MAATSWDPLQPKIRGAGGEIAPIYKFPEAATQSYKAGAVVELVGGAVTACDNGAERILGIVQEDASGVTSADAYVQVARPGDLIEMGCVDAAATDVLVDASGLKAGYTYAVAIDGNGVCNADLNTENAVTEELVFVQPVYDANGDSTYRGVFVLEGVAAQLQGGTA